MAIKFIVCDLDETLLNDEGMVDDLTTDLLIRAQESGVKVGLASGRSYKRMLHVAEKLQLAKNDGLLIDVNGTSVVKMATQKRQRLALLDKDDMFELFNYFKDKNVEIQFNLDDAIYIYLPNNIYELKKRIRAEMKLPEDYPWTGGSFGWLADMRDGYPYSYLVDDPALVPEEINKVSLNQDLPFLDALLQNIKDNNELTDYSLVKTSERTIGITKKGVDKGNALKAVMNQLALLPDEVVVFGNAENDVSMFHCTKHSYAVDNASESVKEQAACTTFSNNDYGVYKALKKLLPEEIVIANDKKIEELLKRK